MSTPIVPPRPSRANGTATELMPQVPPRPARKTDPSPSRDFRSPLNELPNPLGGGGLAKRVSQSNLSTVEAPPRPPSVQNLPTLGQEGSEYASYELLSAEAPAATEGASSTTLGSSGEISKNISAEMPLHAPRASVPQSTAKSRIETVTKTDSTQAAAAGIGKAKPEDDVHTTPADSSTSLDVPPPSSTRPEDLKRIPSADPFPLRQKSSFTAASPGVPTSSRPQSVYENDQEHGIPQIGKHTPLNPMAGDAQAPLSAQTQSQYAQGVGFFNDGSTRAHQRRKSGRHEYGPPGSYGLHSHSLEPHDQFERDWYSKNPDRAAQEGSNLYGRPKPQTALSTVELNRIVTQSADAEAPAAIGTPGEEVGYSAAELYAARSSPKPSPAPPTRERTKRPSSGSQVATESPLRRESNPWDRSDQAIENDDDTIHIDSPEMRGNRYSGGGYADGAIDLGPQAGNTDEKGGFFLERGDGTPILASDEVMKRKASSYMQPAVNMEYHDDYDSDPYHDSSRRSSVRPPSRPSSRPGSIHGEYMGGNLHRFISHDDPHHGSGVHTPLEEIEEYEPLIPEGEEDSPRKRPKAAAVKRRPGLEQHHFPSQDIWEDTPSSLQFSTTVQTPDIPREEKEVDPFSKATAAQKNPMDRTQTDMFGNDKAFVKATPGSYALEYRPGAQHFPSKDIWEDTPSSMQFQTVVGGPQMDETRSVPEDRATTSAIPGSQEDGEARATTGAGVSQTYRPSVPSRPRRRSKLAEEIKPDTPAESQNQTRDLGEEKVPSPDKAKAPPIPDRPKPTVPNRPARSSRSDQADNAAADLSKTTSADSQSSADTVTSPPAPKTKPVVPARPGGEKIAAMKAGFMNDLNNRLKIGPQAAQPKTRDIEPDAAAADETEKAPLADARKGRAKGPPRRKAGAAASEAAEEAPLSFSMSTHTMWSIDENNELQVPSTSAPPAAVEEPSLEKALTANTDSNVQEPELTEPKAPEKEPEKPLSPPPAAESVDAMSSEEQKSLETRLKAALADVGAGPAVTEETGKDVTAPAETKNEMDTTTADKAIEDELSVTNETEETAAS